MQYFAKLLICCVALHSLFASAKESKVRLKSSDDVMFEVDQAVAFESQTIKNMIEDMGTESAVLLPDVSGKILAKVIEYCRYHVNAAKTTDEKIAIWEEDVKKWYQEFVKVDQATLFDLVVGQGFVENFYHIDRVPEKSAILEEDAKKWDPDVVKVDQATFLDHVLGSGFVEVSCHIGRFPEKSAMSEEDVKKWDLEFVKVDQATLFNLVLAANYLNIKNLLDLTCQTVADMVKGKTQEEIRKTFNINYDFAPEEEEEIRRENEWAFE